MARRVSKFLHRSARVPAIAMFQPGSGPLTVVIQPLLSGFRSSQRALAPGAARRVSPVMASVTFIYPRDTGCAPVHKLPREWYTTIYRGGGSTDEVWFCHRAEEWEAVADILPTAYGNGQMVISGTTWSWAQ